MKLSNKIIAEFLGTFALVLFSCGCAMGTAGFAPGVSYLAVAITFGLTIVALAYIIGPVSGCHVNPAVSFAMLLKKKLKAMEFVWYVVAQILGAIAAAALLLALKNTFGWTAGAFATNSVGVDPTAGQYVLGFAAEIILTFFFIFTILGVTKDDRHFSVAGLVIGGSLTFVHLLGMSITGTSVNPARSIGPAIMQALAEGGSTVPLSQIWIFILAPLVGAALAVLVFNLFNKGNPEYENNALKDE